MRFPCIASVEERHPHRMCVGGSIPSAWVTEDMRMFRDCSACKYCSVDYSFDEETGEEYPIYECTKGNDTDLDFECKDFKKYKPKKYVEKDTECDCCQNAHFCSMLSGTAFDCTNMFDKHSHVLYSRDYCCKINGSKWNDILKLRESGLKDSEIIEKISNEKLVEMVRYVKENGIELPESIKEQCRKAGFEV